MVARIISARQSRHPPFSTQRHSCQADLPDGFGLDGCSATTSSYVEYLGLQRSLQRWDRQQRRRPRGLLRPCLQERGDRYRQINALRGRNSQPLTAIGGFNYLWSTGKTSQSITVSQSNIYQVSATNGQGCTATGNFSLVVHPLPLTAVASIHSVRWTP